MVAENPLRKHIEICRRYLPKFLPSSHLLNRFFGLRKTTDFSDGLAAQFPMRRTGWPRVVADPGLPQIRARIRAYGYGDQSVIAPALSWFNPFGLCFVTIGQVFDWLPLRQQATEYVFGVLVNDKPSPLVIKNLL